MPLKARCHCGATQFEIDTAPEEVSSCNCSFCSKRGVLWAYYRPAQFRLTTARDRVSTYQWDHYIGQHHHCAICGCGTFSEFPSFDGLQRSAHLDQRAPDRGLRPRRRAGEGGQWEGVLMCPREAVMNREGQLNRVRLA